MNDHARSMCEMIVEGLEIDARYTATRVNNLCYWIPRFGEPPQWALRLEKNFDDAEAQLVRALEAIRHARIVIQEARAEACAEAAE